MATSTGVRAFARLPQDVQAILQTRICDLGLKIAGSPMEKFAARLYRELERKGLRKFRPQIYFSDEWGCPNAEPVIGAPLYLADPRLARLEREVNDLEDAREIMMYLRHEAGHAFCFAYELYKTEEWQQLFGSWRRKYRDDYRPTPFAPEFVTYLPGWYAQKHPDEDFAETFAVWLTPGSGWRRKYKGTPALDKLLYMERIARKLRNKEPLRRGETDITADEMDMTVAEFYEQSLSAQPAPVEAPSENDLRDIFRSHKKGRKKLRQACELVRENRKALADNIARWTGVQRPIVKRLLENVEARAQELNIQSDAREEQQHLMELAAYVSVLALENLRRRTSSSRTGSRPRVEKQRGGGENLPPPAKPVASDTAGVKEPKSGTGADSQS
jgi:hypothetical protein